MIEIYSMVPKQENAVWLEIGEKYDIIDPHTVNARHGGNVQNQIIGVQPAIIEMDYYNAWVRLRPMGTAISSLAFLNFMCYAI